MPRARLARLGLLSMVFLNAGCSERSTSHPAAAMPAHASEAVPAQPSSAQTPGLVASTSGVRAPTTPAGAQFSRWLEAFNSGDREILLAYHEQHFPYAAASADVSSIDREHGLSRGTNGFTEKQVEHGTPTTLTILLEERDRRQFARVHLEVEPSPPHRVTRFEIGPIPTPRQFLFREELAQRHLDAARRGAVLGALSRELEAHYLFADVAQKMSESLGQKAARGGYDAVTDVAELAEVLTEDLQQVSHDEHLRVRFGPMPPPPPSARAAALSEAPPPWMVAQNFGFGPTERQPGNVALLTLNGFVPLLGAAVEEAIGARMSEIADADAVIIDLRRNNGGSPDTVAFIASYFFEAKAALLSSIHRRDTGETRELWTRPELPGKRFGSAKPVYVLTSARTFSGGEDLAYTLQAHQRAVVVGEVTAGGAHTTEPRAIDADLHVIVPWGRSINPITKSNWHGTGVRPDVPSTAELAPARALQALEARKQPRPK